MCRLRKAIYVVAVYSIGVSDRLSVQFMWGFVWLRRAAPLPLGMMLLGTIRLRVPVLSGFGSPGL